MFDYLKAFIGFCLLWIGGTIFVLSMGLAIFLFIEKEYWVVFPAIISSFIGFSIMKYGLDL